MLSESRILRLPIRGTEKGSVRGQKEGRATGAFFNRILVPFNFPKAINLGPGKLLASSFILS